VITLPSAYSIPRIYEQEINAVITAGYYSNKSEVVRDALRNFFEKKTQLRRAAAIEMYKKEEVTLSKGAEIAGMNFAEFKDLLIDRGIKIKAAKGTELEKGIRLLKRLRKK
jgi:predicted HTH domain antitoxin